MEEKTQSQSGVDWATLLFFILGLAFGITAGLQDWKLDPFLDAVSLIILAATLLISALTAGLKGKVFGIIVALAGSVFATILLTFLGMPPLSALMVTLGISCLSVLSSIFFGTRHQKRI
ncbi:hypothetical protein [Fretibacter rubidus]|uniref:hypothetical protein n=1 Tax=Fretibacter rubidus TaxID=570162 RepID=UPI00352A8F82